MLATTVLGLAVLQVLLALWMYRKLPLAGRPPRSVPVTHVGDGFIPVHDGGAGTRGDISSFRQGLFVG